MQNINSLKLKDIEVLGEDRKSILKIDDLEISSKDKIGIKGPSGAGKSTFLNLINGIIKAQKGKVLWNNLDINCLNQSKKDAFRLENIGMVFQNFYLFEELNAFDNVSLSSCFSKTKKNQIRQNAKMYLDFFNLKDINSRSVASFSGGERQRIAVARALSTDPDIIIADEPTASLDEENAFILINDLLRLANEKNKMLLIVSHDDSLLEKMDKIIHIENGQIKEISKALR